jgi:signal transduction histidine kinase
LLAVYYHDIPQKKEIELLKSEFMATAAHELRTPMSSILGFSELLLVHEFERTDQKEMLTIIAEQARRINGMLNELLDLEKIEARQGMDFDLKIHDLRQIVENVTDSFATSCSNFTLEFPTEPLLANIDQAKIIQALNNLISNAIKFSPKDAPIHIASTIKTCQIGSRISISIHDCGIGMTPDQVAHMGERFYRADTSGRVLGTGLGVALVMEIAKFHGGSLKIKSQLGAGSSFTLELPHIASNEIETIQ